MIPWMQLKEERGIELRWVDIDDAGRLKMDELKAHLKDRKAKMAAVTATSNVLGTKTPIPEIVTLAHAAGALVLVDAAQSVAHTKTDVRAWDADFVAFSGHKLYGPTGIGVLYGKRSLLAKMPPFLGGGMMIGGVTTDGFTAADGPARFEGGTPAVAEAAGLKAAIDWLSQYSWKDIVAHETSLIALAAKELGTIEGLTILGAPEGSLLSFVVEGVHPHDLTEILGREGICLRAGHHCAQPLHRRLGITASTRLSVALYNTPEEIYRVAPAIKEVVKKLRMKN
jgi:cysteine desulfurase/selenocysteine lyase